MIALAPTICVVIAVRNAARSLDACIRSILDQSLGRVEIIVIDGASTDGSLEIVKQHAGALAHWESERDSGVYEAWNKALAHVKADWILFLGSDDRLHGPDALSGVAPALAHAAERFRVVYGLVNLIDRTGKVTATLGEPWVRAQPALRRGTMLPHPATFHHRSLFDAHGRFDTRYRIAGDYEFLLRELLDHDAYFVPHTVTDMATGGLSDRPETDGRRVREKWRARHTHGLTSTPEWLSPSGVRTVAFSWLVRRFGMGSAERLRTAYRRLRRSDRRA